MRAYSSNGQFGCKYNYIGDDLGVSYNTQVSIFKVWCPEAEKVKVLLYDKGSGGKPFKELGMDYTEDGVWTAKEHNDLNGIYYTYQVTRNGHITEAVDPYAKAVGVNGNRGMVVDLEATNPIGWESQKIPVLKSPTDAVIYELHIRDLSIDTHGNITHKGKFLGLTETGTVSEDGEKTGLDHIKELGVTHVQLLPCYDYNSIDENKLDKEQFNWGYDPQNYNVPEGSYSTDPYHGAVRINEYKQAIMALHNNGLGVIMDVVYNHTADGEESLFNKLVPHYYHRVFDDGEYSNGSACGNEIASERFMVRKMITDSLIYWAKEYKIDGFRFDLMGILDIETMNHIRHELDKVNKNIILYGEGWTGGDCAISEDLRAMKKNAPKLDRIGVFNDDIRDAVKGSVFIADKKGFISGGEDTEESVKFGIVGSTNYKGIDFEKVNYSDAYYANEPGQCINYVSAHDDLTLWDKIGLSCPEADTNDKKAMQKLSGAIVLLSQGVPFLHAGAEMARTKYGCRNSYKSPDKINKLRWHRKTMFKDVFDYYKGLIEVRKTHPAFRMRTTQEIQERLSFMQMPEKNMIGYKITSQEAEESWKEIVTIFNGNTKDIEVTLEKSGWSVMINDEHAGNISLEEINSNKVIVKKKSTLLLVKK